MLMIYGLKHGVQKTNQCNNPITKPLVEIVRLWTHFCRHQGIRILPINSYRLTHSYVTAKFFVDHLTLS